MGKRTRLLPGAHGQQVICMVQFAVLSHVSRAGGPGSIKLLTAFPRVPAISSFSSSPGKPSSPNPDQGASETARSQVPPAPGGKHVTSLAASQQASEHIMPGCILSLSSLHSFTPISSSSPRKKK